jgi:hypothetical protein
LHLSIGRRRRSGATASCVPVFTEKIMALRFLKQARLLAALSSAAWLALAHSPAQAQCRLFKKDPPCCTTPTPCPSETPEPEKKPDTTTPPSATTTPPSPDLSFTAPASSAGFGETVALAAPNMIGNLLGAGNSLSFFYQRTQGSVFINGTGSTNIINPKVADNNSPEPQDRVAFRYNYFENSLAVVGDSGQKVFDPSLGLSKFSAPRFRGIPAVQKYNVQDYTFSAETTFLDRLASVEIRVPFSHTLSHNLNLSVADVTSVGRDIDGDSSQSVLGTTPTPGKTLGSADTEFGNMSLLLKAVAYKNNWLLVSGGLALGIPSGPDSRTSVTDYLGDGEDNDIEVQRLRTFHIHNDTWSVSPFLAVLAVPNQRLFMQGFAQVDFPLNRSKIDYSEHASINTEPAELQFGSVNIVDHIRDQILLQLDFGTGYWLFRNSDRPWITGIAPTVELHYTTTLDNADIRSMPLAPRGSALQVVGPNGNLIPEPNPRVGNLRNRIDLLDLTFGATFEICNQATVATGFAFPLRGGDNKTYDWEFQLQVNFYFGGPRRAPAF